MAFFYDMKTYKIIAVLALLVVFPAVSYWYLMKGYNFRLTALQELENKRVVEDFPFLASERNPLRGRASLIFDGNHSQALDLIETVYKEFSDREEFQVIGFVNDSVRMSIYPATSQWITVVDSYPYDLDISLIDTSSTIRNYYDFDSTSFTKLVQHIPIIIPRKKEKDIVLKRDDEK